MISEQGRNLTIAIVGGLAFGSLAGLVAVDGVPLTYFFLQVNGWVQMGWYWQLFTSLVVAPWGYLGLIDVLFNSLAVLFLDGLLSTAFEPRQYYAVFILSGLAGNVLSLLNGPSEISFGASGGIFGLLAGAIALDWVVERRVDYAVVAWFLLVFALSSFGLPYVDWLAHLGGSFFGLFAGYVVGVTRDQAPDYSAL